MGLHDKNGEFEIGDPKVALSGDDLVEDTYVGTPGLWELKISKSPDSGIHTADDIDDYATNLLNINAIVNPKIGMIKSSSSG